MSTCHTEGDGLNEGLTKARATAVFAGAIKIMAFE
jgi:hypothetical protein